jgi:hypothetical protein
MRFVNLTTLKQKISGWFYEKRVERRMKAFLRSLSRQIVDDSNVTVRAPGPGRAVGFMTINVVKIDKSNNFLLQNCIARGWVEEKYPVTVPEEGSAPTVRQTLDGTFQFAYTLTKLGWDIINRAYVLMYLAIILSAVGVILNALNALHKSK